MNNQFTIFDMLYPTYKITKPIRLIEFFAGYGSQALALKYLGIDFEHWKICEWAVKSIQAYKDIHFTNKDITFKEERTKEEMVEFLYQKGISSNYNEPMSKEQIARLREDKLRTIIKNIGITNNLVNIQQTKGKDLEIKDLDKYTYILTYSFPCQDLSTAGKKKGMKDTSTRSGMLWEVERILDECKELNTLPQVLLMENVPQVHGVENVDDFNKWQSKLESLGYKNYFQDLIATDYEIPQTRNRCFMVSVQGNYSYTFPQPLKLKLKLKDVLENDVDEKYYLSDKMIQGMKNTKFESYKLENKLLDENGVASTILARFEGAPQVIGTYQYAKSDKFMNGKERFQEGKEVSDTLQTTQKEGIVEINLKKELCNKLIKENLVEEGDVVKHSYTQQILDGNKKCVEKNDGNMITLTTRGDCVGVVVKQPELRIRKLTPRECFRLMGVKDEDYDNVRLNQTDSSLYHLAGDSIVVNVLMAIFKEML